MSEANERLFTERLRRYTTALGNEKPDRVPIRPFVAEFTAKYAGYTCQEVTHDYQKAFRAWHLAWAQRELAHRDHSPRAT